MIMNLINKCIKYMESEDIYQWNEFYPTLEIIEKDLQEERLYVLKDKDQCIACVGIDDEEPEEYKSINWFTNGEKVLVIHRLAVHPTYQGKGMAKKLMTFIESIVGENNYTCIRLDAYSGNEKALKLYENLGYKKVGQVYFPKRELPFYCYEKKIEPIYRS